MTNFQKAFCVVLSLCFFVVLALVPGEIIRRSNVFGQLPLYCFLEDKARSIPKSEDPETLEKIIAVNADYLGEKIRRENQAGQKADKPSKEREGQEQEAQEQEAQEQGTQEQEAPEQEAQEQETPQEELSPVRAAAAAIKPHPRVDLSAEMLADYDYLLGQFFIVDPGTATNESQLNAARFLGEDLSIKKAKDPQILIYHSHSQETFIDSREGKEEDTIVGVGDYLTKLLREDYGYEVIHVRETFDIVNGVIDRSAAYDYSRAYVEQVLASTLPSRW